MSVGKESESKGCFSVGYKGSTANSVALEKIRPSAPKAIVKSWNLFFKSLPIVAVFASPSNSAAHDKAHSQVLMLHLSMHFNPLPVLKFIAGKQNLPFHTHILNAPGMDEFLCWSWGLPYMYVVCCTFIATEKYCAKHWMKGDVRDLGLIQSWILGSFSHTWLRLCY